MNNRKTWIDALKGIAMCGVIARHAGGGVLTPPLGQVLTAGANGVQLFFVISAMLSFMSLDKYYQGAGKPKTIKWTIRKLVALIPMFYLAIPLYMLFAENSVWLGSQSNVSVGNVLSHILLLHGFFPKYMNSILSVEWYLGVLVIFYLLAPYIHRVITTLERALMFLIGTIAFSDVLIPILIGMVGNISDSELYVQAISEFGIIAQLPVLAIGIVAYFVIKDDNFENIKNKRIFSISIFIFALIIIWGLATETTNVNLISRDTIFGFAALLLIVSQQCKSLAIIDNGLFRVIGRYSYPIYLFHYLLIQLYERYAVIDIQYDLVNWIIKFLIILVVSTILGIVLTRFVDEPIKKFIEKSRN